MHLVYIITFCAKCRLSCDSTFVMMRLRIKWNDGDDNDDCDDVISRKEISMRMDMGYFVLYMELKIDCCADSPNGWQL